MASTRLLIACIAVLISSATAHSQTFLFSFYVQPADVQVPVRRIWAAEDGGLPGNLMEALCTRTAESSSDRYATLAGLSFAVRWDSKLVTDNVYYIKFEEGRFSDGVLYLRCQSKLDPERPVQYGAIVGGTGVLAGAHGNLTFTQDLEHDGSRGLYRVDGAFGIKS